MCNKQTIVDKYNSDIKKTGGNYLYNNGSASEFITKKKKYGYDVINVQF